MMLDIFFFGCLALYAVSMALNFLNLALKNRILPRVVWIAFLAGFVLHTVYLVHRGNIAGRLPMSNQFEFAMSFAWGVSLLYAVLRARFSAHWITTIALPSVFLLVLYAAFLPREIKDLMPALRSPWFGVHIGTAAISYAAFVLAGGAGVKYLVDLKKGAPEDETPQHEGHLRQIDFFSYRLIGLGILMLSATILTGSIWAEEAWSRFWAWDPKELWAFITWIVYAIYLHQRFRKKWQGKRMAIFAIVAVGVVLFTFIGVNTLLPGLHSYR